MFIPLRSMAKFSFWLVLLSYGVSVHAQSLPRWEAGLGLFGVSIPYYRGAEEGYNFAVPYPVFRFRGDKFSVDSRDSAKRWLYVSDRFKIHLSLAFGLPVIEGSKEREGMEHLPSLIEVGPKLAVKLASFGGHALAVKVPIRAGYSVDLDSIAYQGWVTAPYLHYLFQTWGQNRWKVAVASGLAYSNQQYQSFYYAVPEKLGGYSPSGGYGGWWNSLAVYKAIGRFELSVYGRYDFLEHTSFEDSPLVSVKRYFASGVNLVWWFARSRAQVEIDPKETY